MDTISNDCNTDDLSFFNLVDFINYCLYVPLVLTGPFVTYSDFQIGVIELEIDLWIDLLKNVFYGIFQMNSHPKPWTNERIIKSIIKFLRYLFWLIVIQLLTKNVIFVPLFRDASKLSKFATLPTIGFSIFYCHYFFLKYLVMYGIKQPFVEANDIPYPKIPKCISTIHSHSESFRKFDEGIYNFIKKYVSWFSCLCLVFIQDICFRYIYNPIKGCNHGFFHMFLGSAISFTFAFCWHGFTYPIFVWSFCNFIGNTMEMICKKISNHPRYQKLEVITVKHIS